MIEKINELAPHTFSSFNICLLQINTFFKRLFCSAGGFPRRGVRVTIGASCQFKSVSATRVCPFRDASIMQVIPSFKQKNILSNHSTIYDLYKSNIVSNFLAHEI